MIVTVRTTQGVYEAIREDIVENDPNETILFGFLKRVRWRDETLYLLGSVIVLGVDEAVRSPMFVRASDEFLYWFYRGFKVGGLAEGFRVVTIHSHPFQVRGASFSLIDWGAMREDSVAYRDCYGGVEFVWIVFDGDAGAFAGVVVRQDGFVCVDRLVVVGGRLTVFEGVDLDGFKL